MKRGAVALAVSFAALIGLASSCRDATQVTLDITYGDPCGRLRGVGIIATTDARAAEQRATRGEYTTVTTSCTDAANLTSRVGTLSVSPGDGRTRAAITIVAGVDTPADRCRPENAFKGCIVARRSFAFLAHSAPTFPIRLEPVCKDVPCDAETTCKKGACVDAAAECNDDECVDKVPDDVVGDDGGADGSSDGATDGGGVDGPVGDAVSDSTLVDSDVDGGSATLCQPASNAQRVCPPYVDPAPICTMNCALTSAGSATCQAPMGEFNASCTASRQCAPGDTCCWPGPGQNFAYCIMGACAGRLLCRADCDCAAVPGTSCKYGTAPAEPPFVKLCKP